MRQASPMISKRVNNTELSFTISLRLEADKRRARGEEIIDLGLGDISFRQPPRFTEALIESARKGVNRYTEPSGILKLRQAISEANNNLYGGRYKGKIVQLKFSPEEIVHATSAKLLIFASILSSTDPGDEIILLAPYWPSYVDLLLLASVVPKICYTSFENKFFPTKKQLSKIITKKPKQLLLIPPIIQPIEYIQKKNWNLSRKYQRKLI